MMMVNEMRIIKFPSKDQLEVGFLFKFHSMKTVRYKNKISVHMFRISIFSAGYVHTHTHKNQFPNLTENTEKMALSLLVSKCARLMFVFDLYFFYLLYFHMKGRTKTIKFSIFCRHNTIRSNEKA